MARLQDLQRGREAWQRSAWAEAYAHLASADRATPLQPADLDLLATAALLSGHDDDAVAAWTKAQTRHLNDGDPCKAARCAFWIGFALTEKGDSAQASGWFARARRVLHTAQADCVEAGYLLYPEGFQQAMQGDPSAAYETFRRAADIADRHADADLSALARHAQGRVMVMLGDTARGMAVLDEVMVAVTSGEVTPVIAGSVYCSVIEACRHTHDLQRGREWTAALSRWCDAQPDLVLYRGQCLVHRCEIMVLGGEWTSALGEARRACERLADPPQPAIGAAWYQQAELHRLRGEHSKAEEAYRRSSRYGHDPHPGLALLRLAQGKTAQALAAIRRATDEAQDPASRSALLAPLVEIELAAGHTAPARAAANELREIAARVDTPMLSASATRAHGAVLVSEGHVQRACAALRAAWILWRDLAVPYEAARTRALLSTACHLLGDEDSADLELDAARVAFRQLGAAPDLKRLADPATRPRGGGLTRREQEVLKLVAAGRTNRAIAEVLVISEKTVARHMSNIFAKLGVSSRTAATAYAYEHDLV